MLSVAVDSRNNDAFKHPCSRLNALTHHALFFFSDAAVVFLKRVAKEIGLEFHCVEVNMTTISVFISISSILKLPRLSKAYQFPIY